ncbi:helix-turn-helix transcriptional regulator [Cypionkella psychrotolerans]|uniref:helix-turn-helix transcriptional regulator n=1 Tax=Cypionkella psychrotolerans TaxID=1678131 RepID=UPI0006B673CD|nr:helix-turn-helix domain-containing protein [Cypionkella psychrotolerans]
MNGAEDLALRLTREELAHHWRVSVRTIERWSATGLCPRPLRMGGRILYRREDVLAWERGQTGEALD